MASQKCEGPARHGDDGESQKVGQLGGEIDPTDSLSPSRAGAQVSLAKRAMKRETFQTSRLLDFCSERELIKQIGHGVDQWPLVIFKELVDNGLDACEEAGIAPVIEIEVTGTEITITDNGPGIPADTVA